ncbi:hypothetical protein PFISCL1PPCAC_4947, partial [Pristionchus fissidentatus]
GHPRRELLTCRYGERQRYEEWNDQPLKLHRRHLRRTTVALTMQEWQLDLEEKENGKAAREELKTKCSLWTSTNREKFNENRSPKCLYPHVERTWKGDGPADGRTHEVWPLHHFNRNNELLEKKAVP